MGGYVSITEDMWITIIGGIFTLAGIAIGGLAKRQASRADRRVAEAEQKAEDHEERLAKLEPAFGDGINHIRDLRGHINRGDPPPPPPLPTSLVHYYYDLN